MKVSRNFAEYILKPNIPVLENVENSWNSEFRINSSKISLILREFFCGPSLYSGSFVAFSEFWFSWFSTDSKNSDRILIWIVRMVRSLAYRTFQLRSEYHGLWGFLRLRPWELLQLMQKLLASGASAFLALPTAARRKDSFGSSFAVDNMHFLFAFSYDFFRCQLVCEASCRNLTCRQ